MSYGFLEDLLAVTVFFWGVALATALLVAPIILAVTIDSWFALLYVGTFPLATVVMTSVAWLLDRW